jgi:histidinol-phosphate aminotransferase
MLAAVTARTRIIYLCNPNNPTGNFVPGEIYDALLDNISDDIVIISDEVYKPFVTHPGYPDTTPLIHAGKNLIQVYSFSKAYGLAGLRLGYGIASPEIAGYLARLMRFFHLGRLTLNAGLAAVDDQAHMKRTVDTIVAGREWLTEQLQALGVRVWPSQGNFILLSAGIPGHQMVERLLAAGIMVTDGGPRFKLPDCIRVTVGLPEHNRRFVSAIKEIINNPSNVNTN